MTTEVERLSGRLYGDPTKKVKNFGFTIDKEAFAKTYGGTYIPGDFGPLDGYIDWTFSSFTVEERTEGLAKELNDFMDAAEDPKRSHRLSSTTDKWGTLLDEKHMDYMTFDERLEHVELCRRAGGGHYAPSVRSRYEWEMVIEGHIEPEGDRTVADYEVEWEARQQNRDDNYGGRYPRIDKQDALDGHLDVQPI